MNNKQLWGLTACGRSGDTSVDINETLSGETSYEIKISNHSFGGLAAFIYCTLLTIKNLRDPLHRQQYLTNIEKKEILICVQCEESFTGRELKDSKCPFCNASEVEILKVFYKRHPEKVKKGEPPTISHKNDSVEADKEFLGVLLTVIVFIFSLAFVIIKFIIK